MNHNYNWDHVSSTFFDASKLMIAGSILAAQCLPTDYQKIYNTDPIDFNCFYQKKNNPDTYSVVLKSISYMSPVETSESSWIAQELSDFMQHSRHVTLNAMNELRSALRETYGDVKIETTVHTDPEEEWVMPVITVHSGIEDFDRLLQVEDGFFARAEINPTLSEMLPFVIISQA